MKRLWHVATLLVFIGVSSPALPWGAEGHKAVGAIADALLAGHPAAQKVRDVLGFDLQEAGLWADCIRSVEEDHGTFTYKHHPYYGKHCVGFVSPSEKTRMEDYARRNWTNCVSHSGRPCHAEYHFADVGIHHYDYSRAYKGTFTHDIVHAINAAIAVLKDMPAPAPFSVKDKKEALFLLAHFVGDLHQPLHVGSVYLTEDGKLVNPDGPAGLDKTTETNGGNLLGEKPTMHAEWDGIPGDLLGGPTDALIEKAKLVPATPGPVGAWASMWASESVRAAHTAFTGVTFSGDGERWKVRYSDRTAYLATQDKLKRDQLAKGGARLAELLKAIWP